MRHGISRRALGRASLATFGSFAILRHARGEEQLKIRCSLDTAPSHVRNVSIVDYLGKLEQASGGKITSEVFHSRPALRRPQRLQGAAAGPGRDGRARCVDADRPGARLRHGAAALVLRRADRGHAQGERRQARRAHQQASSRPSSARTCSDRGSISATRTGTRPRSRSTSSPTLKGLKIRSPGGAGISLAHQVRRRHRQHHAWPNVPLALSARARSTPSSRPTRAATRPSCGKRACKYSYADHQFMGQYIPMIARTFWDKLSADQQKLMRRPVGAEHRHLSHECRRQPGQRARKTMENNGVKFVDPSRRGVGGGAQGGCRRTSTTLIKDAKLSPEVVKYCRGGRRHRPPDQSIARGHDTIWDRIERTLVGLLGATGHGGRARPGARALFLSRPMPSRWAEEVIVYLVDLGRDDHLEPARAHRRPCAARPGAARWSGPAGSAGWKCSTASWRWSFCVGMVWYGCRSSSVAPGCSTSTAPRTLRSRCGSTMRRCRPAGC